MRLLFAASLILHAAVHGYAFASAFGLGARLLPRRLEARVEAFDNGELGSLLLGMCWGALGAAIAVAGFADFFATAWWPSYAATVLSASLCLCLIEWQVCAAARLGAFVNAILLATLWFSHLLDVVL